MGESETARKNVPHKGGIAAKWPQEEEATSSSSDSPDLELNSEDVSVGRTGDETNLTLENCQSPTLSSHYGSTPPSCLLAEFRGNFTCEFIVSVLTDIPHV